MGDGSGVEVGGRVAQAYLRHEYAVVYVVAGVTYTLVGMHAKVLLNWIVGPLWPVACMWWGPPAVRRLMGWKAPLP